MKTEANVWENPSAYQAKTRDAVEGFYLLEHSHTLYHGLHQDMKAMIACVIFFIKLFFSDLTKIKNIN